MEASFDMVGWGLIQSADRRHGRLFDMKTKLISDIMTDTHLDMRASHFPKGSLTPATSSLPGLTPALIQQAITIAENVNEDKDVLLKVL